MNKDIIIKALNARIFVLRTNIHNFCCDPSSFLEISLNRSSAPKEDYAEAYANHILGLVNEIRAHQIEIDNLKNDPPT